MNINKEQGKIVSKIFRMYLVGESAYEVAKALNSQGVPTYSNKELVEKIIVFDDKVTVEFKSDWIYK